MNDNIILQRFRDLIDNASVPRKTIADEIGCDVSTVTKHYTGDRNFTVDYVIKYAKFFNVSADYLLGLSDVKTQNRDLRFVCDYTKLSEEAVRKLTSCGEEHSDSLNFRVIFNHFVSSGAFVDVFSELGQYLKANVKLEEMQKQVVKLSNEEQLSEVESEQYSKLSNELKLIEREANFSLFNAQELMSNFVRGLL